MRLKGSYYTCKFLNNKVIRLIYFNKNKGLPFFYLSAVCVLSLLLSYSRIEWGNCVNTVFYPFNHGTIALQINSSNMLRIPIIMATFIPVKSWMQAQEQKVHLVVIQQLLLYFFFFLICFSGPSHSRATSELHLARGSNEAECVPAENRLLSHQLKPERSLFCICMYVYEQTS